MLNVYRNFGLKTPRCYGYLDTFITHSSQLHSFLCPNFSLSKMFDVGDRDLQVPTSGN